MHTAPERKLTTILAADAAGYSAMMERDEAGTLALLKDSRETMAAEIERHRGRVVGMVGDGLLAEFASVVNAVECAVRIQRGIAERNVGLGEAARMRFRIGINLGDVMVEGGDLFGEGVNIAARLQALAEPGGILISGPVFEQVRTKLALGFDFLGPQSVKNMSEAVPAWRVVLEGDERGRQASIHFREEKVPATHADVKVGQSKGGAPSALTGSLSDHPLPTGESNRRRLPPRQRLLRRAAFAAIPIAALFVINMLTYTERAGLWFQWPTLGILTAFALRSAWVMGRA
jgi:adenylate cyclase